MRGKAVGVGGGTCAILCIFTQNEVPLHTWAYLLVSVDWFAHSMSMSEGQEVNSLMKYASLIIA